MSFRCLFTFDLITNSLFVFLDVYLIFGFSFVGFVSLGRFIDDFIYFGAVVDAIMYVNVGACTNVCMNCISHLVISFHVLTPINVFVTDIILVDKPLPPHFDFYEHLTKIVYLFYGRF